MVDKEEQVKGIAHVITSEQCSRLPHIDMGSRMFVVKGGLSYEIIKVIAEQIYHQGYRK